MDRFGSRTGRKCSQLPMEPHSLAPLASAWHHANKASYRGTPRPTCGDHPRRWRQGGPRPGDRVRHGGSQPGWIGRAVGFEASSGHRCALGPLGARAALPPPGVLPRGRCSRHGVRPPPRPASPSSPRSTGRPYSAPRPRANTGRWESPGRRSARPPGSAPSAGVRVQPGEPRREVPQGLVDHGPNGPEGMDLGDSLLGLDVAPHVSLLRIAAAHVVASW